MTALGPAAVVRVTVSADWLVLPARSTAWTVKELAPIAKATPGNWKVPEPAAVAVRFVPASVTCWPGSVWPTRVTREALVLVPAPAPRRKVGTPGGLLSIVTTRKPGAAVVPPALLAVAVKA